jgi:hypothetical protein
MSSGGIVDREAITAAFDAVDAALDGVAGLGFDALTTQECLGLLERSERWRQRLPGSHDVAPRRAQHGARQHDTLSAGAGLLTRHRGTGHTPFVPHCGEVGRARATAATCSAKPVETMSIQPCSPRGAADAWPPLLPDQPEDPRVGHLAVEDAVLSERTFPHAAEFRELVPTARCSPHPGPSRGRSAGRSSCRSRSCSTARNAPRRSSSATPTPPRCSCSSTAQRRGVSRVRRAASGVPATGQNG